MYQHVKFSFLEQHHFCAGRKMYGEKIYFLYWHSFDKGSFTNNALYKAFLKNILWQKILNPDETFYDKRKIKLFYHR